MKTGTLTRFTQHVLPGGYRFFSGSLPVPLRWNTAVFEEVWRLHPPDFHVISMHGKLVPTPRWQQAYGVPYHYTGRTNTGPPVPPVLQPLLTWAQQTIEPRVNGLLLNSYDAELGHSIGKHRDSIKNMVVDAPIITLSFDAPRVFRLRPWRAPGLLNFPAVDGTVFVMPYDTNLAYTHEVPHRRVDRGRRISVTMRAFEP